MQKTLKPTSPDPVLQTFVFHLFILDLKGFDGFYIFFPPCLLLEDI